MSNNENLDPNSMLAIMIWDRHIANLTHGDNEPYKGAPLPISKKMALCTDRKLDWWKPFFANVAYAFGRGNFFGGAESSNRMLKNKEYYESNPKEARFVALEAFFKTEGIEERNYLLKLIGEDDESLTECDSYISVHGKDWSDNFELSKLTSEEELSQTISMKIISSSDNDSSYWSSANDEDVIPGVDFENGEQSNSWAKFVFGASEDIDWSDEEFEEKENYDLEEIEKPYNRIVYGAPGTGKSHVLELDAKYYFEDNWARTTFHPEYSYADFIGTYRPIPIFSTDEKHFTYVNKEPVRPVGTPHVIYKFEAGAFTKILKTAINNPSRNYLLIIEEINRANVSAVFGEIFQLLDRKNKQYVENHGGRIGDSQYPVNMAEDILSYVYSEKNVGENRIIIPGNLYLWATLNSTDDGVSPMDSAFKRRWSFEHISIDYLGAVNSVSNWTIPSEASMIGGMKWNDFRNIINNRLRSQEGLFREDQLLAPRFFKEKELNDIHLFKNKLLDYLHQQLLRHDPSILFKAKYGSSNFSLLMSDFETKNVFNGQLKFTESEEE